MHSVQGISTTHHPMLQVDRTSVTNVQGCNHGIHCHKIRGVHICHNFVNKKIAQERFQFRACKKPGMCHKGPRMSTIFQTVHDSNYLNMLSKNTSVQICHNFVNKKSVQFCEPTPSQVTHITSPQMRLQSDMQHGVPRISSCVQICHNFVNKKSCPREVSVSCM